MRSLHLDSPGDCLASGGRLSRAAAAWRCTPVEVVAGLFRFVPPQLTSPEGQISLGPGIEASSCSRFGTAGCIGASFTWNFQFWYREPLGPCGAALNTSNALAVTFAP